MELVPTSADEASSRVGVVIVTYDPGPVIKAVIDAIDQEAPAAVVVVDNSPQSSWELSEALADHPSIRLVARPDNLGFCAGSNLGLSMLPATDYVLFLNPDAVVGPGFVASAANLLDQHLEAAALNPKLIRLDSDTLRSTGEIDCAGIFATWYGRPYDRGQGTADDGRYDGAPEPVPALCGAAMFCRREMLDAVATDGQVFDDAFFMYKEDIDLSYRLRQHGWTLLLAPSLVVGHVRGVRSVTADPQALRSLRRRSLSNDWRVWRKGNMPTRLRVPMFGYLIAKTVRVRLLPWRLR